MSLKKRIILHKTLSTHSCATMRKLPLCLEVTWNNYKMELEISRDEGIGPMTWRKTRKTREINIFAQHGHLCSAMRHLNVWTNACISFIHRYCIPLSDVYISFLILFSLVSCTWLVFSPFFSFFFYRTAVSLQHIVFLLRCKLKATMRHA